ncbi:MAG: phenylalanyl-tRNA synthetase alpha chain [Planctomycetota bacterium]|jgi:phenylalanyl-tRNA synthetase alpha chain
MKPIEDMREQALKELGVTSDAAGLESWRITYLGKKGPVQDLMKQLKDLPKEAKPLFGQLVNQLKNELKEAHAAAKDKFGTAAPKGGKQADLTLPGIEPLIGSRHPITQMMDQMISCMTSLGFEVAEGPEVEDEVHNFNALNIPANHPARSEADNFYLSDDQLLRSQTSTVQIRVMEKRKPPLRIIAPGRVYRPDTVDASHHYMFHQIEGLAVDRGLTMQDMKSTLIQFFAGLFGEDLEIRLRPNFFPFTEPSAEVDVACPFCKGSGCSTCQQKGWIEMGGCGMVDPNVFRAVGYDPEEYTGFAFGLGIERMAMRQFGIPDIRYLTENDTRFLSQFL